MIDLFHVLEFNGVPIQIEASERFEEFVALKANMV